MANQMYDWVKPVNPLAGGPCIHNCDYCYMKSLKTRFTHISEKYSGEPRIDDKGLAEIRGTGKTIFVGSATDMFAANVPGELIQQIMIQCWKYPGNTYLWQTKTPRRFKDFMWLFPNKSILATTIEGFEGGNFSRAPGVPQRLMALKEFVPIIRQRAHLPKIMISVEPVMWFSRQEIIWITEIKPDIISIGANTSNERLSKEAEPDAGGLLELIEKMREITPDVRLKDNLKRIIGEADLFMLQKHIDFDMGRIHLCGKVNDENEQGA